MKLLLLALAALALLTPIAAAGPRTYHDPVYNDAVVRSMIGSRHGDTIEEVLTGVPRRP